MSNGKNRSLTQERLLTLQDIAGHLRISLKTARRWIDSGELAAFKIGRQWRISETDLRKFLRERWKG